MPWRRKVTPYRTWVSEIMLQQTRVETVIPYFERWMRRFPSVGALAEAPLDDVLQHWAGLGYYARARNLHAAAREIQDKHGGRFPSEPEQIRALPGIGRYTAGAIASIAFGKPEPILDGNVARVLSRVFRVDGDDKALWKLAAELVPSEAPGDFNQALMELGATVCAPKEPRCAECPVSSLCGARASGEQARFPPPRKKASVRAVEKIAVVCARGDEVLMVKRPAAGLWGGLWEPPTGERERGEDELRAAARVLAGATGLRLDRAVELDRFEHVLTHRRMRFVAFRGAGRGRLRLSGYEAARWLPAERAAELGIAAWTSRLLERL
jgi:A/G-specific adenine glycosylase